MNPYHFVADNGGIRYLLEGRWPEGVPVPHETPHEVAAQQAHERRWLNRLLDVATATAVVVTLVVLVAFGFHVSERLP